MTALASWAQWRPPQRPWSIGLEEEVMLLDGHAAAGRSLEVLAALPSAVAALAAPETHSCALELRTRPHATVAEAVTELGGLRQSLATTLATLGLRGAAAGTHPCADWRQVGITAVTRYQAIDASMRVLARREPTFALHVHVAVPDGHTAARALAGLREELPLVLALSANSPFWQGRDSGLACARIPILSMFPRVGIPPHTGSYREYVAAVEVLTASGAVPDHSFLWWDARLRPHLGTLEVRICDAQTRIADTAALAALIQCLVHHHAEAPAPDAPSLTAEALAENRFLACRDGIASHFIRASPARLHPAADRLARVLWDCAPIAEELACARELASVSALAARPGHESQRATAQPGGPAAVVAALADEFTGARAGIPREHQRASLSGDAPALTIG
jgi:carboxylate-amine ligase